MKKCPNCGKVVDNDAVRCSCGANVSDAPQTNEDVTVTTAPSSTKRGKYQMTMWDVLLLIICNISVTVIIVNVILGPAYWCHYVVLGLFGTYFLAFAIASRSIKKFLSRYRNAVLLLNFIAGMFGLFLPGNEMKWANNYFIPCNLILAGFVFLLLLFHKDISARTVIFSTVFLLLQSTTQLILFGFKQIGYQSVDGVLQLMKVPQILIILAFTLNLMTLINIIFLYVTKFKNSVVEKFRWWE